MQLNQPVRLRRLSKTSRKAPPSTMPVAQLKNSSKLASAEGMDAFVSLTKAAGDRLRANVLRLLARDSFSVAELSSLLGAAQNALSHHLKGLVQAGLIERRREATSHFYRRVAPALDTPHGSLVSALFEALDACELEPELVGQMPNIIAQRQRKSRAFFARLSESQGAVLRAQQAEICSTDVYSPLLVEMANTLYEERQSALEIGPGDMQLASGLLDLYQAVTVIDSAPNMLDRARDIARTNGSLNVLDADLDMLASNLRFDAIAAAMVLHHQPQPAAFFAQAAEHLNPGGLLLIAELDRHEQDWVREACGDLWLGFEPDELHNWATDHGFVARSDQYLALRNGFRVQLHAYSQPSHTPFSNHSTSSKEPMS